PTCCTCARPRARPATAMRGRFMLRGNSAAPSAQRRLYFVDRRRCSRCPRRFAVEALAELGGETPEIADLGKSPGALARIGTAGAAVVARDQTEADDIGTLRHGGAEALAEPCEARLVAR